MINLIILKNNREQGFVLVTAMVFLLALTLLGLLAVNNSTFERLLGGNERLQVDTFYEADSGIGAAIGLLGMNIELKGFNTNEAGAMRGIGFDAAAYTATNPFSFYMTANTDLVTFRGTPVPDLNGDGNNDGTDEGIFFGQNALSQNGTFYREAFYPRNPQPGGVPGQIPTTSIKITANDATFSAGSAIQSNEGYHGLGAGVASGGAEKIYGIRSRHDNINNAVAQMHIQWRHVIK